MLTIKRLDLDDARVMIKAATEKANALGVAMCIAVVDDSGFLIAFERIDGCKALSTHLAQDKAFTAAISRKSTEAHNAACQPGNLANGMNTAMGGRFSLVGGGVPVVVDGEFVGAIGVSGGKPEEDIQCADAGIAAWEGRS